MLKNNLPLKVGDVFSLDREITRELITDFAFISGDTNAIHIDDEVAARSMFGGIVAHGMLTASFISAVFGVVLPGEGWIYRTQILKFTAPVYIGDMVKAEVRVKAFTYNERNTVVTFDTICYSNDKKVLVGEAELVAPTEA